MRLTFTLCAILTLSCTERERSLINLLDAVSCADATAAVIPNDGIDDRATLQAALNACAGASVKLRPAGLFEVATPPAPRPLAMLTIPANTTLEGLGTSTVLRFTGDNSRKDWRGMQVLSGARVTNLAPETSFTYGTTVEQTHIMSIVGPIADIRIDHITCSHPQNGSKSGDCIQLVCYPPSPGQPDKRCWDIEIDHSRFPVSGRSGVAFHSGLHGSVSATGHRTSRIHHNVFSCISDQATDGEGTGDTEGVEIDHNTFELCPAPESALAVQIQASRRMWVHDNKLEGRGMEVLGCDECLFEDNHVVQSVAGDGGFPVRLRNVSSNVVFADEVYEREASAGIGAVLTISAKDAAPRDITIQDSRLIQRSQGSLIAATGIQGLAIRHTSLEYLGPARLADAVTAVGSGSAGCPSGVRADRTELADVVVTGLLRSVLMTTGSYCGSGSVDIQRTSAVPYPAGPQQGLRCENVSTGAGVLGPVTYADNTLHAPACAGLWP